MLGIPVAPHSAAVGVALGVAMSAASTVAIASAQRTFVASTGSDANSANNCSIVLPCRSFAAALGVTSAGGEVLVRDSAGYGTVSIGQSVSIVAPPGVYAGISVPSGAGVAVSGSGLKVVLRGLTINGQGGSAGISVFGSNLEVHIEGPVISGLAGVAIQAGGTGTRVYVTDAELRSNSNDGIQISAGARVYVDRARMEENGQGGASVFNDGELYVRDSVVHRNNSGLEAIIFSGNTGTIRLVIERTLISGSSFGGINVQVQGNAPNRVDAVVTGTTLVDNAGAGYNGINFQCFGTAAGVLTLTDSTISHHLASNATGM